MILQGNTVFLLHMVTQEIMNKIQVNFDKLLFHIQQKNAKGVNSKPEVVIQADGISSVAIKPEVEVQEDKSQDCKWEY